ncbi:MAG TPA: BON domain-containing protein [Longimicrobium sp.]
MRTPAELQRDVLDELAWEPEIDPATVAVTVRGRDVTLTGAVPTVAGRHAAETAARRVWGVRRVANALAVEPAPVLAAV